MAQWEKLDLGTHPSIDNLARLAVALAVPFEWLATGRGSTQLEDVAVPPIHSFGKDDLEARILMALRQLPTKKRTLVGKIVNELLTKGDREGEILLNSTSNDVTSHSFGCEISSHKWGHVTFLKVI